MKRLLFFALVVLLLISACTARQVTQPSATAAGPENTLEPTSLPSTMAEAHDVLVNFLALLNTKQYADAAPLYGCEYEQLQIFNSEIDSADHVALWAWACDNQLLQCLAVRSITFKQLRGDSYVFQVEFSYPDGGLFVLGPCCGVDETEMPPVSQFEYTVSRNADMKFVVMNTPRMCHSSPRSRRNVASGLCERSGALSATHAFVAANAPHSAQDGKAVAKAT